MIKVASAETNFVARWAIASAVGFGLGWTFSVAAHSYYWIGITLGIVQALVLVPRWWVVLLWPAVTGLGWALGVAVVSAVNSPSRGWYEFPGWLPFFTVPVLTLFQWIVVSNVFRKETFILWFGASVCGFPVAGFLGIVVFMVLDPATRPFLWICHPRFPSVLAYPGALYGVFTGMALRRARPDFLTGSPLNSLAVTALWLSAADFTLFLHHRDS